MELFDRIDRIYMMKKLFCLSGRKAKTFISPPGRETKFFYMKKVC